MIMEERDDMGMTTETMVPQHPGTPVPTPSFTKCQGSFFLLFQLVLLPAPPCHKHKVGGVSLFSSNVMLPPSLSAREVN
jgi:hypothetical protein